MIWSNGKNGICIDNDIGSSLVLGIGLIQARNMGIGLNTPNDTSLPRSALHLAAAGGHLSTLYHIVANAGNINAQDNDGATPLNKV